MTFIVGLFNVRLCQHCSVQLRSAISWFRRWTISLCREVTSLLVQTTRSPVNKVNCGRLFFSCHYSLLHLTHCPILGATFWFTNASPQVRHPTIHSALRKWQESCNQIIFTWTTCSGRLLMGKNFPVFYSSSSVFNISTFNSGNWNTLEINVRSFAGRLNRDLLMYTGTWVGSCLFYMIQFEV